MKVPLDILVMPRLENFLAWNIASIIFLLIFSYTNIYIFINLFRIKVSQSKKLKACLISVILNYLFSIIIPTPYYYIISTVIDISLFRIFFKQSFEKCILGGTINFVAIVCLKVIFARIFLVVSDGRYTFYEEISNINYYINLMMSISLVRALLAYYIKVFDINLKISNHLSVENKFDIIFVSIVGCIFIFLSMKVLLRRMSYFSNNIFIIEMLFLTTYFYISVKSALKSVKIDEKDMKIHNLEEYNNTLLVLYDNVRVFKHNYFNFVQALNGYAKINDVNGIKLMCNSIYKECTEVITMENLNPKIINNPAIYSILVNKYCLAKKENIDMNIEVMYDLNDIEVYIYEISNILGILVDNAIEAAKKCKEKIVNVKFIKDSKTGNKLMIVENSYKDFDIDIDKIFEKGYSTKKHDLENHGLGLWNVKKTISHCDNLNIYTSKGKLFSQKIEIVEEKNCKTVVNH